MNCLQDEYELTNPQNKSTKPGYDTQPHLCEKTNWNSNWNLGQFPIGMSFSVQGTMDSNIENLNSYWNSDWFQLEFRLVPISIWAQFPIENNLEFQLDFL
jgi:hypothetical protein